MRNLVFWFLGIIFLVLDASAVNLLDDRWKIVFDGFNFESSGCMLPSEYRYYVIGGDVEIIETQNNDVMNVFYQYRNEGVMIGPAYYHCNTFVFKGKKLVIYRDDGDYSSNAANPGFEERKNFEDEIFNHLIECVLQRGEAEFAQDENKIIIHNFAIFHHILKLKVSDENPLGIMETIEKRYFVESPSGKISSLIPRQESEKKLIETCRCQQMILQRENLNDEKPNPLNDVAQPVPTDDVQPKKKRARKGEYTVTTDKGSYFLNKWKNAYKKV